MDNKVFERFIIEKLTIEQVPQFHSVFSQVMQQGFEYTPRIKEYFITKAYSAANFEYWLKYDYKSVLVASLKMVRPFEGSDLKEIIAFLVYDAPCGGVLFARWLGVLGEYQKQGAGRQLLDEFIKEAKALGCHKIEIASQPSAREFYQKYELAEEGFRRQSYFGIDQYLFGKVIGEADEERMTS